MNNIMNYSKMLDLIENDIVNFKIKTSESKIKIAATLFSVTLDHAKGIKICLINSAYSSAFALLRIQFETYIRAMWLWKCADQNQINQYIDNDTLVNKNGKKLSFGDMVLEVELIHDLPQYFSEIKNNTWTGLNSLTHSGSIQLNKNFNGKSIIHCYDSNDIAEAIQFSTMISCMAFAGLCDLATNISGDEKANKILMFVKPWFNKKN